MNQQLTSVGIELVSKAYAWEMQWALAAVVARKLGDQLKFSKDEAHLFHDSNVSDQAVMGLTFSDFTQRLHLRLKYF